MPKARNPTTFSKHFKIDRKKLDSLGVFDPTLAIDTKLFIDPLLLPKSHFPEINMKAVKQYRQYFEKVIKLLSGSKKVEDVAWRTARRLLEFHEMRGTCLGYGAGSISGSGFGPDLTERVLNVGKEIVDLGINDPDLFQAMALLEDKVGPDRISDMATNIIQGSLAEYNRRILRKLRLRGRKFRFDGIVGEFLVNPFQSKKTPIILVPRDILRKLPVAHDWDGVAAAARKTAALRKRINLHISEIWAGQAKREKRNLRKQALSGRDAFQTLLDAIHGVSAKPYNTSTDPEGLVQWANKAEEYSARFPLNIAKQKKSLRTIYDVVKIIISQFRQLIEQNGLNKELYKENHTPRHESTAQRLFFAVAYCYCRANNLDISPEVDTGSGKIDFKFSVGFKGKVLVELKLSRNNKLVVGYQTQLEIYKLAEKTSRAFYLIINVGHLGNKYKHILARQKAAISRKEPLSDLVLIDGIIKASASKR